MSIEEQAQTLAEWLERHPGTDPPADLDPEVVEAVYALRPDLAPAPKVTADDILASLTAGPLADPAAPAPVPAPETAEEPELAPVVSLDARRRRRRVMWAGAGVGSVLAMAAAAALFVGVAFTTGDRYVATEAEPAAPGYGAPDAQPAARSIREEYDAVASLDEDLDLPEDEAGVAFDGELPVPDPSAEPEPVRVASRPAPSPKPTAVSRPAPKPSPAPVSSEDYEAVADLGDEDERTRDARYDLSTAVGGEDASGAGEAMGPQGKTVAHAKPAAAAMPVAENEERAPSEVGAVADGWDTGVAASEPTLDAPVATGARSARRAPEEVPEADVDDVSETVALESRKSPFRVRLGRKDKSETRASEAMDPEPPAVATAEAPPPPRAPYLDALRTAAIPPELPEAELMNRNAVPAQTWQSVVTDRDGGRYIQAADKLREHVSPPVDQGQTNAAQATHYYRQAGDDAKALETAQQGLSLSMNTPEAAWLLVYTGDALRQQGDFDGAEVAYREAIQMNEARNAPQSRPMREMQMDATSAPPTTTSDE